MKNLLFCLVVAVLCSVSLLAGRRTTMEHFASHIAHEMNELDQLQTDIAGQK